MMHEDDIYRTAPDLQEDKALVLAALAEPRNYGRVVAKYAPALRRYIGRLLGNASAGVDDVLQEAFIKAYVNLNGYDQMRAFAPWLYRIAHNESVNHLRRSKSVHLEIGGEDGEILMNNIAAGNGYMPNPGLRQSLQQAFSQLPADYRDVLVLRLLEDKSYAEISDILALPSGTVAIRIKRGMARLQDSLQDWKD
jgi:RNA polymerase sigma-70 factor, ECF subfamily